ncbi:MAG: hypothetical protein FWF35_04855, partial [Elusimicrobia bacterium]|nr:hypothetical protein [Elusimicrobiota bacterium]
MPLTRVKLTVLLLFCLASFSFAQTTVTTASQLSTEIGTNGTADILLGNNIALGGTNIVQNTSPTYAVTISGGGLYGFTGALGTNLFVPATGQTFTLNDINFTVTSAAATRIIANNGTAYLNNVSVTNSTSSSSNNLIRNNATGTMTIDNSTFSGNTATGGITGGVVNNAASGAQLSINGSTFSGNTNNGQGGALYNIAGATANITDTSFIGNSSTASGTGGGAIYNDGTMNITAENANVVFSGNRSTSLGGAITNGNVTTAVLTITADNADVVFGDSTGATSNSAGSNGGVIQNRNNATLNLVTNNGDINFVGKNTDVTGNNAINVGGNLYVKLGAGNVFFDTNNNITGAATADHIYVMDNPLSAGLGGQLLINSDASGYLGAFSSQGGITTITSGGKMFGGGTALNTVSGGGVVNVTDSSIYYGITVNNGGTLNNYTTSASTMNIGGTSTSSLAFGASGGTMNFDIDSSLTQGSFNLAGKIDNGSANTVNLNNANVTLALNDYTGATTYGFNNDTLTISDPAASTSNPVLRNVNFTNLTSNNTTLNFNISMTDAGFGTATGGQSVLNSDTLTATTSSGTFNLGAIGMLQDQDDGLNKTYDAKVLFGGATFAPSSPTPSLVVTNIYTYLASVDPSATGILLTVQSATDENSLNAANTYVGNSSFNMTYFDNQTTTYNIGASLDNAAAGQLLVQGVNPAQSVIDGTLVDSSNTPTGGNGSFFKLTNATDFTLQDLTIQNAAGVNGPILNVSSASATAVLNDLTIQNNAATGNGGAIYVSNGTVNISGGTGTTMFYNNTAASAGGAIYNTGGSVTISGSTFDSNAITTSTTNSNGGAISNTGGTLTLNAGNVFENTQNITNAYNGGAVYNGGATATSNITSNTFKGLQATNGGAAYNISSGYMTISGSTFDSNSASNYGGAVYNVASMDISGSIFDSNSSISYGGAIYNGSGMTISGSTFDSNITNNYGGAISNVGGTLTLNAGNVFKNTQNVTNAYNGGVIFSTSSATTIINAGNTFTGFMASNGGGVIYNASGTVTISGSPTFASNSAGTGGAIYNVGTTGITGANFVSNTAASYGGSIYSSGSATIGGTTFDSNTAGLRAGAIYNTGSLTLNAGNSFTNTANSVNAAKGGAIYNIGASADTAIADNTFTGLQASQDGGAIYNDTGTVTVTDAGTGTTFTSNTATGNGGAIYNAAALALTSAVNDITFNGNKAGGSGGAIYNITSADVSLVDVNFIGNTAGGNGGAISNTGTGTLEIDGGIPGDTPGSDSQTEFSNNSATGLGGAIYNTGAVILDSTNEDISFSGNTAGGVANDIYTTGTIAVNGTAGSVVIGGGIAGTAAAVINKSGAGDFLINGNSSGYVGALNNSAGNTIATAAYFDGLSNISGGTVELAQGSSIESGTIFNVGAAGTLLISTGDDMTVAGGQINDLSGAGGLVNKTGAGTLTLTGDNSVFDGTFDQSAGVTTVGAVDTMFAGTNNISNSTLNITTSHGLYYNATLGNSGILNNYNTAAASTDIGGPGSSITFASGAAGAVMNFGADPSLTQATYNLVADVPNAAGNTVNFSDSLVTLGAASYTGGGTYSLNNSVLDLTSPSGGTTLNNVVFSTLNASNNSSLNFNLSITDPTQTNSVISSDTLNTGGGTGTLKLGAIGLLQDEDDGVHGTYDATVLTGGGVTFDTSSPSSLVVTNIYTYTASVDSAATGVLLTATGASDEFSLNAANTYVGNSSFNMTYFTPLPSTYNIGASLDNAATGQLLVQGVNPSQSIIDGTLVDSDGAPVGGKGSFFKLTDATDFTLQDLTIQNAAGTDGPVLNVSSADATAALNNLVIQNNTATGNGGAIYQDSGVDNVSVSNSTLTGNSATNGGAMYVASGAVDVSGATTFSGNTASNQGGAIYNAGTVNLDSTAGNITFSGNSASSAANGADIYNAGGTINIDGTTGTTTVGDGIAGTGTINKSNGGALAINGDSSNYTGTFNQSGGTTTAKAAYFGGLSSISGGTVELAQGSSISSGTRFDVGTAGTLLISTGDDMTVAGGQINDLSGAGGTVTKTGAGTLTLTGDNSVFDGTYNQTDGTTTVDAADTMFAGTNNISDSTLNVTTANGLYYNATLGNNGILNNLDTTAASTDIGGTGSSITFASGASGAVMNFGAAAGLAQAAYNLVTDVPNAAGNTVNFTDSLVTLGSTNYTGGGTYSLDNSVLDITTPSGGTTLNTVNFSTLSAADNSSLNFNLSITNPTGTNSVISSDTLNTANGAGTLKLGNIGLLEDQDDGTHSSYDAEVLSGGITFDTASPSTMVVTSIYKYTAAVDPYATGVLLTATGASSNNSLNAANVYAGDSAFDMTYFSPQPSTYNIGASLDNAADGTLLVQGAGASQDTIDGTLVDNNGTPAGGNGSFFKLNGTTDLTLQNLTIENAAANGTNSSLLGTNTTDGSVLNITSATSAAALNNLTVKNNTAAGNGGAVYVDSGASNVSVETSAFTGNSAADGGAMYIASGSGANIYDGSSFTNNTASGQGGAIYNAGTILMDTTAGDITFSGNKAASAADGNDIYNTGSISFDGANNIIIGDGIAGTVSAVIDKPGAGELLINGDSSGYLGTF